MSSAFPSPSTSTTSATSSAAYGQTYFDSLSGSPGWSEAARWAINAVVIVVVVVASAFFYYRYRKLRRLALNRELPRELTGDVRRANGSTAEEDTAVLDYEQLAILPVSKYDPDKVRNSTCPICLEDFDVSNRHRRRHSNQSMSSSFSEADMTDVIISKPPSVVSISRSSQRQPSDLGTDSTPRTYNRLIRRLPCGHGFCVTCIGEVKFRFMLCNASIC